MFDKITIKPETEYIPYTKSVTITENRAATDESVKLLNEFQEKSLENLIKTVKISNNVIDGVIFLFQVNAASFQRRFVFIFKINGVEHKIEDNYDIDNIMHFSNSRNIDETANKIISKLSEIIAIHLFKSDLNFWEEIILSETGEQLKNHRKF